MNKVKLTKSEKEIIRKLCAKKYPAKVPDDDRKGFLRLESLGFVTHLQIDQSVFDLYNPELTEKGQSYLKEYPKLTNPCWISKNDILSLIAQIISNIVKS